MLPVRGTYPAEIVTLGVNQRAVTYLCYFFRSCCCCFSKWLYSVAVVFLFRILVERILNTSLVPFSLDAVDRMKRLYTLYANLDEHAVK